MLTRECPTPVITVQEDMSNDENQNVADITNNHVDDGEDFVYLESVIRLSNTARVDSRAGEVGKDSHQNQGGLL